MTARTSGGHRSRGSTDGYVSQVAAVECDTPTHTPWVLDERWHRSAPQVTGRCGSP